MAIEISARKREAQGTGASRRLRRAGRVPGVIYGGEHGPVLSAAPVQPARPEPEAIPLASAG